VALTPNRLFLLIDTFAIRFAELGFYDDVKREVIRALKTALFIMGFLGLFGCSKRHVEQSTQPKFTELSREDVNRLELQRQVIAAVAKERYGLEALNKTKADLAVLQRLLDDRVFSRSQTYEWQCLGIAFGDVLVSELPLRWIMVTDEYGTDPTLRYKNSSIQINALTMISKRVERGEEVNVAALLRMTEEQTARLEREFQK
jgi:hypothetical protein